MIDYYMICIITHINTRFIRFSHFISTHIPKYNAILSQCLMNILQGRTKKKRTQKIKRNNIRKTEVLNSLFYNHESLLQGDFFHLIFFHKCVSNILNGFLLAYFDHLFPFSSLFPSSFFLPFPFHLIF